MYNSKYYYTADVNPDLGSLQWPGSKVDTLYAVGSDASKPSTLAQENAFNMMPINQGNIALFLDGKFIGPIVDYVGGYSYQDTITPGQILPRATYTPNPWDPKNRMGVYYIAKALRNTTPSTNEVASIEFRPYYMTKLLANGTFRLAVSSPRAGYVSDNLFLTKAVVGNVGKNLIINGQVIGPITAVGSNNLSLDGNLLSFYSLTGTNPGTNPLQETYVEVANPLVVPSFNQNAIIDIDVPTTPEALFVDGKLMLTNVPPIKEGIGGLVGKRLIINEIFIGVVTANTLTSIDTALVDYVDLDFLPTNVSGIWRLATTDATGRAPLCTATYIAVSDYPNYPYLDITVPYGSEISHNPSLFKYYPDGNKVYTRRVNTNSLNSVTDRLMSITIPAWMEHGVLNTTNHTCFIDGDGDADLGKPAIFKYSKALSTLNVSFPALKDFTKYWQIGEVIQVYYEEALAALNQASPYVASTGRSGAFLNYKQNLQDVYPDTANMSWNKLYQEIDLAPVVTTGVALKPNITVATPTGPVITDMYGKLIPGTVIIDLLASTVIVDGVGKLPAGIPVETTAGIVEVLPNGTLPPGTVVNTDVGTSIVDGAGLLPPGTVVLSLYGIAIVDAGGLVPSGVGVWYLATATTEVKPLLLSVQMFECATAPQEYSYDILCLERCMPNTFDNLLEASSIALLGPEYVLECSTLQQVALTTTTSLGLTSVMAPLVSLELPIQRSSSPAVTGTKILFKRGLKANLPASAAIGEPLVTLDTAELFVGTGTGLRKISDVVVSEVEPAVEDRSKLWYNPTSKVTLVYKDGSWQQTTADSTMDYGEF